jgi:hypothetical protein
VFKDWGFRSWIVFAVLWFAVVSLTRLVYTPASTLANIAVAVLVAGLCVLLIRRFQSRADAAPEEIATASASPVATDPPPVLNVWEKLGMDPQTREESIRRLFDTRSGTIEFETQWDFDYAYQQNSGAIEQAYSSMSFRLARPLEELGNRECEALRAAYLLYNDGLIDAQTWRDLTFGSIYGEGAAAIISCEYREPVPLPFSDDEGAIRYYAAAHAVTLEHTEHKLREIQHPQIKGSV